MTSLLLTALVAVGDPPPSVTLPAEVKAQPGRLMQLTACTNGRLVRWALASDDADLIPFPDGRTALFCAPRPGRHLVLAWTAAGDVPSEAARCVVLVGDPAPPAPVPPADPLSMEFRKLLAEDPAVEKLQHLAQLAALYREAIRYADHPDVKSAGDLAARLRIAAGTLLPPGVLAGVRGRIADEIAKTLPLDGEALLDAATRRTAARLFARIAIALEAAR